MTTTDIVLAQFPNKSVEVPPLGTSVLTASARANGLTCVQHDLNVDLKHEFLQHDTLLRLVDEILPHLWKLNVDNPALADRVGTLMALLRALRSEAMLGELTRVRDMMQARRYEEVFCDRDAAAVFRRLLPVLSLSNCFFDLVATGDSLERDFADLFVYQRVDALLGSVATLCPTMFGVSVVEMQRQFSLWALRRLRERYDYRGTIVVGGSDATYFTREYLASFPMIDYVVQREGERAILPLVRHLRGELPAQEVPNLAYRSALSIKVNDCGSSAPAIDLVPDFADLPLHRYLTDALPVQASRGCSWARCTYCKHFRTYGSDYYEADPSAVVDHVQALVERYGSRLFHFVDDEFPPDLKNAVSAALIERALGIEWLTYSRFDARITPDMLRTWKRAGLTVIEWGLESASQDVLDGVRKGIHLDTVRRLLLDAHAAGILSKVFMFHNLPGEEYEDLLSSLSFLRTFVATGVIRPFWEILTPLELLAGTPLYEQSCSDAGNAVFRRVFSPRGELVAQAGYVHLADSRVKDALLRGGISELRDACMRNGVLEMNDEAVLIDVVLERLRAQGRPLHLHSRLHREGH